MKTILVIEDDKDLAATLALALKRHDYAVSPCYRLRESLAQIKHIKPALVLVDVMLPDGAGYTLSRHIRMDPELYKTPILFMSCLGEGPEIEYALSQGGDEYLTKPFTLRDLLEKLAILEALQERIEHVSPLTGMHSLDALKREIDFRILHHIDFTACLVSIAHFREYVAARGEEHGRKILGWTGQLFRRVMRDLNLHDAHAARVKGEQFLATVPPRNAEAFCKELQFEFRLKVPDFCAGLEVHGGNFAVSPSSVGPERHPVMELEVETLSTRDSAFPSANALIGKFAPHIHNGELLTEIAPSP